MMEYNYTTRKKLLEEYQSRSKTKTFFYSKDVKGLISEMKIWSEYTFTDIPNIVSAIKEISKQKNISPSQIMKKKMKQLVEYFIPKEYQGDYYYIIDKSNQFQYSSGTDRRSVRSSEYKIDYYEVFRLIKDYYLFGIYECNLADYITNRLPEEKLDFKLHISSYEFHIKHMDDMIAAGIDSGDGKLKVAIQDIILSENNTGIITVDIIRGIVKSSDKDLHKLLGDFLLAARLQEGVRQAICENMDCGIVEAFLTLFIVIYDNNLIRYSSVKRAVATWTGLCDLENIDRITKKVVDLIHTCLQDKSLAYEYTKSNDSIEIYLSLWALGFYDVKDAIGIMEQYMLNGTKNQKLTMSYYNLSLSNEDFVEITSKKVMEQYHDDLELVAAFMPSYLCDSGHYVYNLTYDNYNKPVKDRKYVRLPINYLFKDEQEAKLHFQILKKIYQSMEKKTMDFSPCIFPWYSVRLTKTDLIKRLCIIAYALQDNTCIDYAALQLSCIDTSNTEYYAGRHHLMEILLNRPRTDVQKETLLQCIADKESETRKLAFAFVQNMQLDVLHFEKLEEMLRFKNTEIRQNVINLLIKQEGNQLIASIERILKSKREEVRTAGLDIILQLQKDKKRISIYNQCIDLVKCMENPTEKEKILIEEICGESKALKIQNEKGFGIYSPEAQFHVPYIKTEKEKIKEFFCLSKEELDRLFTKLDLFIEEHRLLTYKTIDGDEELLGNARNGFHFITYNISKSETDNIPFKDLWCEFFENEIKNFKTLLNMLVAILPGLQNIKGQNLYEKYDEMIFGKVINEYDISGFSYGPDSNKAGSSLYTDILNVLYHIYYDENLMKELATHILLYIIQEIPDKALWYENSYEGYVNFDPYGTALIHSIKFNLFEKCMHNWKDKDEFKHRFYLLYQIDDRFHFNQEKGKKQYYLGTHSLTLLNIFDYIKAYAINIIPKDIIYKAIFDTIGLSSALNELSILVKETVYPYEENKLKPYHLLKNSEFDNDMYQIGLEIYKTVVDKIVDVECKRGDIPTIFSKSIHQIAQVYGLERLVQLLVALGKDKFDRSAYYSWSSDDGKTSCLSHLVKVCYPASDDNADKLKKLLKGTGIKEQRLIEVAMYAPQWIDIIEDFLGYKGLKSGCFYFMAHMNESFDDKKMAMISKYTPLSAEELNFGAFDLNWFKEAYEMLGENTFSKLYDGAKYISNGSKHARGRKYTDAALGRVTVQQLEAIIDDKRNKDLLMSYGLIPLKDKTDMLHRYEYIQKFLKDSKQFGSQRKASEAATVSISLRNLATTAGYRDVTRLTLSMETELIKSYAEYFQWKEIDGISIKCEIDEDGKPNIICMKKDNILMSIPSTIKKDSYVISLKDIHKKLKEQYSRTVKMFESAMEDREQFQLNELIRLCDNEIVKPVVQNLLFISMEGDIGFISNTGLIDYAGNLVSVGQEGYVRVAHPYDFYKAGCWNELQKLFFMEKEATRRKQPFKQVFRELYVKMEEELDKKVSRMFSGYQIQPRKTVACLAGRRWIADYEVGLQKVYYKDNIVANIYAMADWFSPGDIEEPTLEWVEFSDRITFESIPIKDVPDIIYSEVMRDVDLAVSVAHAGGVDPETSHSTIEMRRVIISFNLGLFSLDNVKLDEKHALIKGTKGEYSVHLGSGVVHKIGGAQINVLPVHSQNRGKLFLPFIDDDPKTAEIISKIVLFAKDNKIKDPYILRQM